MIKSIKAIYGRNDEEKELKLFPTTAFYPQAMMLFVFWQVSWLVLCSFQSSFLQPSRPKLAEQWQGW